MTEPREVYQLASQLKGTQPPRAGWITVQRQAELNKYARWFQEQPNKAALVSNNPDVLLEKDPDLYAGIQQFVVWLAARSSIDSPTWAVGAPSDWPPPIVSTAEFHAMEGRIRQLGFATLLKAENVSLRRRTRPSAAIAQTMT